jgi:hypothetical protein
VRVTSDGAAIFRSVGQALHVSFLMEILQPTQRVSTQLLIDSIREQLGKTEARIESTINVGGMSPLEFRGQCAMVVAAVRHHLPHPEHAAVRARFGHQLTKAGGVQDLAEYLQPQTGVQHDLAVRAIVWSQYHRGSQRAADRWSLRAIERETGVPINSLRRCATVVRQVGFALEMRADDRLGELFERTGLTPERDKTLQTA